MTSRLPNGASIVDGEITVDAELLASKLGLSSETLKREMRKGLVYSTVERGEQEDSGNTRLTFRYRATVWRTVLKADGTLVDDPVPRSPVSAT